MKTICHIVIGLNRGGAEKMLCRLILNNKNSELKHIVISLTTLGTLGLKLQESGTMVYALGITYSFVNIFNFLKLVSYLRKINPDIIQTWMYHSDLIGGIFGKLMGYKNIIWGIRTTDILIGSSKKTRIIQYLCAKLSKSIPTAIICAADASRLQHEKLGYDASKMHVIANGFDLVDINQVNRKEFRTNLQIDNNQIIVGVVGRFNLAKDFQNFIAAAKIAANKNYRLRFMLVGKKCDQNNKILINWLDDSGCADKFILLGERDDVSECLNAMDIFCLSSQTEGFPNVLGEAMVMGKLCVTTDVGDAALLLGDCGIVVPKKDPQALAAGILNILALSDAEKTNLIHRSRQRIENNFSIAKAVDKFELIYESILL